jgi:hypothetical protein
MRIQMAWFAITRDVEPLAPTTAAGVGAPVRVRAR